MGAYARANAAPGTVWREFRYVRGMTDVGLVYGACRERITELVRDLDDERAAQRVTATSDWSVHDVVAHLVGIVTEINAGKADGVGAPARTAAQVADRRDRHDRRAPRRVGAGRAAVRRRR